MEVDAGVGVDGLARLFAARAEALDGPAELGCVHIEDEAGLPGFEDAGCAGLVEGGIAEDRKIAALGLDHLEENGQGRAVFQGGFSELAAGKRCGRLAAEMEHPAGKNEGKLAEVFAFRRAVVAEELDRFGDLDPVSGGAAQGLAHIGEQGDGAGTGGLGGGDHEGGQVLERLPACGGRRRSRF